ncbi:Bgt-2336 [Blumeria graminis f. sp. tritici]|uniref:Alanine--tRNA ligase n=3 Tax=Blumeria graminis f. sp. tritici TaxID=62690 RepID=A0A656KMU6_BLUGR|nr:Cytoplasmic alanyl-tRNA synthetase [Blumeria graminis f. sp. tritici 96224]VDB84066.1 Bgt-2336 [Blumeria graminis f. sp. tritici]
MSRNQSHWPASRVRETFLRYFEGKGHIRVPSSSVVPHNDPTLLFTNAGMNQFKPIFLGTVGNTDNMSRLKRAVDTQKCIRAGGKHNDLDDVGKDTYHHASNWSFGDYFKPEAVQMSWELLTKVYGLDPERIYVTYFEGDTSMGLEPDMEIKSLWKDVGVHEDHIIPGNVKDNFWEMGEQGPCGPCSEIHYDKIGGRNAAHLVNMDDPNVLEIWNNVFIQFDRQKNGTLKPLPAKHVDTGMGFERLVSILQNKSSNYDTDVFRIIFSRIQTVTNARPYSDKYGNDDVDGIDTAYRVIADHLRLLTFAISDGCVPNNEGRGYVVRRVLRRGSRYARKYFNVEIGCFFSKILPTLVYQMGGEYPELVRREQNVKEILDEEEEAFARTLDRGERMFEKYAAHAIQTDSKKLSGADVWRLYDTFGFPEDLTKIMAEERGLETDENEIRAAQKLAREASKSVKEIVLTFPKLDVHQISQIDKMGLKQPDDSAKYRKGDINGNVELIYNGKAFLRSTETIPIGTPFGIILDRTNFYAEQGGQISDTGKILIDGVVEFKVLDVQIYGRYIVHNGYLEYGTLKSGDEVICEYDEFRRQSIRSNHTATHILNHSLREHLGDDIIQKGSLVDNDKLRFDFSHKAAITNAELLKVENSSNKYIRQNCKIYTKEVDLEIARNIEGVRAVFGETYPNPVRVVSVGVDIDTLLEDVRNPEWKNISVEFCGGTHVEQTGLIKDLVIVEESGIAKGIRRIIAYTGDAAHEVQRLAIEFSKRIEILEKMPHSSQKEEIVKLTQQDLNKLTISALTKETLKSRFSKVQKDILDEQKKKQKAESKIALDTVNEYFSLPENNTSKAYIGKLPISANLKAITDVMNHFKSKEKDKTVYLFGANLEESIVVHGVYVGTEHSSKGITAESWSAVVSNIVGGRNGGKEPTRTGQGTNPDKIETAITFAKKWLLEQLEK